MAKKRGSNFKEQKSNILIACEGDTEKIYLNKLKSSYRLPTIKIEVVNAEGGSAIKVYKKAKASVIGRKKEEKIDKVFCVFDNDNKNVDTELVPALDSMKKDGYIPIYSNFSFELWLLMHYSTPKAFQSESHLLTALKRYDPEYHKTKYNVDEYIAKLPEAKENSRKLVNQCGIEFPQIKKDIEKNPYTNMCHLIEFLEEEKKK